MNKPFNLREHQTDWKHLMLQELTKLGFIYSEIINEKCHLVLLKEYSFAVNLIALNQKKTAVEYRTLQLAYLAKGFKLVHLWEDVWLSRPKLVLARIQSLIGQNIRIHGRKTKVLKIDKPIADIFLNENHLQAAVNSRYKFGLFSKDDLIAVATFSALRKMNYGDEYYSAELIRFAVKEGFSIAGGLSKLIKAFIDLKKPNDIMTYADMDWSAGESYLKLGFKFVDQMPENYFVLDDHFQRKLINTNSDLAFNTFNTGSLKYILKL